MTGSRWLLVVLVVASLRAAAQEAEPPALLYGAFARGGPIVTGTIAEVHPDVDVVLRVDSRLRGTVAGPTIAIPYSARPNPRRPPMLWVRVPPVVGKHVLVILSQDQPPFAAAEVLDLDAGEGRWLPLIRRMLDLSAPTASRSTLLAATTDGSPLIRTLAFDRLLSDLCATDLGCRRDILERAYGIANDSRATVDQRLEATRIIGLKIYQGSSPSAPLNTTVIEDLFELAASDVPAVRDDAIQMLSGYYFGGGVSKPPVPAFDAARRLRIRRALQSQAQRGRTVAPQAANLATLLGDR